MPKLPKIYLLFAVSLQCLWKEISDEVDFLHASKKESLLQVATMILMGMSSILKVPKVKSLQYLYNISKKKLGIEFIFSMEINIRVSRSWHYRF